MSEDAIKKQRDMFLAFAFASADLLIEISREDKIKFVLGAAKGMTGVDEAELVGKSWLELFSTYDQSVLLQGYENAKPGKRIGPFLVDLNELVTKRKAVVTGIRMPGSHSFYMTLSLSNLTMSQIAGANTAGAGDLLERSTFIDAAQETYEFARSVGQDVDMTVLDFAPTEEDRKRMGEENWGIMLDSISAFLQSQAVDGQTAGQIGLGRYSVVHDKEIDAEYLRDRVQSLALENDPDGEGIVVKAKTIESDLSSLSERDAAKALIYTINEFERKGADLTIENLNSGFKAYAEANASRIKEFEAMIERLDFKLHYQPIVDLKTQEVSHYEILSRFTDGDTLEWVTFGEDMGMAPRFDAAVCELAVNTITRKFAGSRSKFSVNISGQSIEDYDFFEKLREMLKPHEGINERLMFEITESTHIGDLNQVNQFIEMLQEDGFKVALDDFGAGAASFQYLQKLKIDTVKIDGKYIRKLLSSRRDAAMVKNLVQMCIDLGIEVVAEYVEEQSQADLLQEMGVQYGQGYLFGMAQQAPDYKPPQK